MICPKCGNQNDDEYVFCVNCGSTVGGSPQTEAFPSVATVLGAQVRSEDPPPTIRAVVEQRPVQSSLPEAKKSSNTGLKLIIALLGLVILGGAVSGLGYFLYNRSPVATELLPDHLGLFAVEGGNRSLTEVARRELANLKDGRDTIMKESVQPSVSKSVEFILYSDPGEVKTDDLKLLRVDSIADDGRLRQLDFQVSLINEKPAMKRLRFSSPLPNGKYAFAQIRGAFDEGSHRLWVFEVNGSTSADPSQVGREFTVALKEKQPEGTNKPATNVSVNNPVVPKPPTAEVPTGARAAYCNDSNVVVRAAPSLTARKINALRRGQRVYLISYSDNFDYWNGIRSNWAYIQTENGKRGWVFSPFISY
jgi:hypothetical protein